MIQHATRGYGTERRVAVALLAASGLALILGLALHLMAARATRALPAVVNIRWRANVDADARQRLEQQLSLSEPTLKDATTYAYVVRDVSERNLRQIVQHPAVDDTHAVDRATFRISPTAARRRLDDITADPAPTPTARAASALFALGVLV